MRGSLRLSLAMLSNFMRWSLKAFSWIFESIESKSIKAASQAKRKRVEQLSAIRHPGEEEVVVEDEEEEADAFDACD